MFIVLTLTDDRGKVAIHPWNIKSMVEENERTSIEVENGVFEVTEKIARIIALMKQAE